MSPLRLTVLSLGIAAAACAKPAPSPAAVASTPSPSGASAAPTGSESATGSGSVAGNPAASGAPSSASSAPAQGASAAPARADELAGKPAPDFTAATQTGTTLHLAALRGHPVVLYFYPKDETPGCTKEACAFRDTWNAIAKIGATLVGISADTLDSHKAFAGHHKLPFLLVSDPDGAIARSYGVPFSTHHARQTIVIGPDGIVRNVFRHVDVDGHADEVLEVLTHFS
jgi:peroxiredoxin Q/BCP